MIKQTEDKKFRPNITLEGRTPLQDVIPLDTPFVLQVDPSSLCNFRCRFCPTGHKDVLKKTNRWSGLLKIDLFKKIIDDLNEFNAPIKVLRLYKDGEPFLNKHLAEMVAYAKSSGKVQFIETITNGSLLTAERVMPVIEAGIDRINISIDGLSDQQFIDFTQTKVSFDELVRNITHLYNHRGNCKLYIKTVSELVPDKKSKKFFIDTFSPISDIYFIENTAPCWPDFDLEDKAGVTVTDGRFGQDISPIDVCPFIFYQMSINASGKASLCSPDWKHYNIIGDVKTESLKEIWNSDALRKFQIAFLEGKRNQIEFCKDCEAITHFCVDNIDPFKEELLKRIVTKKSCC